MYLLSIALLINLGFSDATFVGHSLKNFETRKECLETAAEIQKKVESKIGSALKRIDMTCVQKGKSTL